MTSSKYRGVSLVKDTVICPKWRAVICLFGPGIEIGCSCSELEAAKKYDELARELMLEHPELELKFKLNFPEVSQ